MQEKQGLQNTHRRRIHTRPHASTQTHTHTNTHTPSHTEKIDYACIVEEMTFTHMSWWLPSVKFPWCITFVYSLFSQRSCLSLSLSLSLSLTFFLPSLSELEVPPVIVSLMNHVPSPTSSSSAHINPLVSCKWKKKKKRIPPKNSLALLLKYWTWFFRELGIETKQT